MKKVILHGKLGDIFGKIWKLDIESFSECIKAIEANKKGFTDYLRGQAQKGIHYGFQSASGRTIDKSDMHLNTSLSQMHIIPLVGGAGGFISLGNLAMSFGMSYLTSYVGGKIMDKLRPKNIPDPDRLQSNSYVFNGTENVIEQGGVVPVGYGELLVGSNVISEAEVNYDFDHKKGIVSNFSYPMDRFRGDNFFSIESNVAGVKKGDISFGGTSYAPGASVNSRLSAEMTAGNDQYRDTFGRIVISESTNVLLGPDAICIEQTLNDGRIISLYNETGAFGLNAAKVGHRFVGSDGVTPITNLTTALETEDKQLGYKKLESLGVYKVIDLISEGPIEGFVDQAGNSYNFENPEDSRAPTICGNVYEPDGRILPPKIACIDSSVEINKNALWKLGQIQTIDESPPYFPDLAAGARISPLVTGINIVDQGFGYEDPNDITFFIAAPRGKEDPIVRASLNNLTEAGELNIAGEIIENLLDPNSGGLGQIKPITFTCPWPGKLPAQTRHPLGAKIFMLAGKNPGPLRAGKEQRPPNYPIVHTDVSNPVGTEGQGAGGGTLFRQVANRPAIGGIEDFGLEELMRLWRVITEDIYVTEPNAAANTADLKFKQVAPELGTVKQAYTNLGNEVYFSDVDLINWPFSQYLNFNLLSIEGNPDDCESLRLRGATQRELLSRSGFKVWYNVWAPIFALGSADQQFDEEGRSAPGGIDGSGTKRLNSGSKSGTQIASKTTKNLFRKKTTKTIVAWILPNSAETDSEGNIYTDGGEDHNPGSTTEFYTDIFGKHDSGDTVIPRDPMKTEIGRIQDEDGNFTRRLYYYRPGENEKIKYGDPREETTGGALKYLSKPIPLGSGGPDALRDHWADKNLGLKPDHLLKQSNLKKCLYPLIPLHHMFGALCMLMDGFRINSETFQEAYLKAPDAATQDARRVALMATDTGKDVIEAYEAIADKMDAVNELKVSTLTIDPASAGGSGNLQIGDSEDFEYREVDADGNEIGGLITDVMIQGVDYWIIPVTFNADVNTTAQNLADDINNNGTITSDTSPGVVGVADPLNLTVTATANAGVVSIVPYSQGGQSSDLSAGSVELTYTPNGLDAVASNPYLIDNAIITILEEAANRATVLALNDALDTYAGARTQLNYNDVITAQNVVVAILETDETAAETAYNTCLAGQLPADGQCAPAGNDACCAEETARDLLTSQVAALRAYYDIWEEIDKATLARDWEGGDTIASLQATYSTALGVFNSSLNDPANPLKLDGGDGPTVFESASNASLFNQKFNPNVYEGSLPASFDIAVTEGGGQGRILCSAFYLWYGKKRKMTGFGAVLGFVAMALAVVFTGGAALVVLAAAGWGAAVGAVLNWAGMHGFKQYQALDSAQNGLMELVNGNTMGESATDEERAVRPNTNIYFNRRFTVPFSIAYRREREVVGAIQKGWDFDATPPVVPRMRIGQFNREGKHAYYDADLKYLRDADFDDGEGGAALFIETDDNYILSKLGFPTTGRDHNGDSYVDGIPPTEGCFNLRDEIEIHLEKPWIGVCDEDLDLKYIDEPISDIIAEITNTNYGYNMLQLMDYYDNVDVNNKTLTTTGYLENKYRDGWLNTNPGEGEKEMPLNNDDEITEAFDDSAFHQEIRFTPQQYLTNTAPAYFQEATARVTVSGGKLSRLYLFDAGFGYPDVTFGENPTIYLTLPHPNPAWQINSGRRNVAGRFSNFISTTKTGISSDNYYNHLIEKNPADPSGNYQQRAVVSDFTLSEEGTITDIDFSNKGRGYVLPVTGEVWSQVLSAYKKPKFKFILGQDTETEYRVTGVILTGNASGYTDEDFINPHTLAPSGLDFWINPPDSTPSGIYGWSKGIYLDGIPVKNTTTNDFNFGRFDFSAAKSAEGEMGSNDNLPLPTGYQFSFRTTDYGEALYGPREKSSVAQPTQDENSNLAATDVEKGENKDESITVNANYEIGAAEYPIVHSIDDLLVSYVYVNFLVEKLLYLYEGDEEEVEMDLTRLACAIIAYVLLEPLLTQWLLEITIGSDAKTGVGVSSPTGGPVPVKNESLSSIAKNVGKTVLEALITVLSASTCLYAGWTLSEKFNIDIDIFKLRAGNKISNSGETRPSFLKAQIEYYNENYNNVSNEDYKKKHISTITFKGVVTGKPYAKDVKIILPPNPNKERRILKISRLSRERDYVRGGEKESRYEEQVSLKSITEVIPVNTSYPNSVVFGSNINAEEFSSIPKREYHLRLKKVKVPDNYFGESRTYDNEIWGGLFKNEVEWTDNPAWCFYDLVNNKSFGLGRFGVDPTYVNKWNLYAIARHCDELVYTGAPNRYPFREFVLDDSDEPSYDPGDGGPLVFENTTLTYDEFVEEFGDGNAAKNSGGDISIFTDTGEIFSRGRIISTESILIGGGPNYRHQVKVRYSSTRFLEDPKPVGTVFKIAKEFGDRLIEPRFSFNALIKDKQDALKLLNDITSLFYAIIYWNNNSIYISADEAKTPTMLFTNSNVDNAGFTYSSTRKDQRFTVCKVRYNDRDDQFKPKIEYVENSAGLQKFGIIENNISPMGLTSKYQAQRAGRYLLSTSVNETEIVNFSTSMEANYLQPGDIIKVMDNNRVNQRLAGMILGVNTTTPDSYIDLDFPLDCIIDSTDTDTYLKFNTYSPSGNILDDDSVANSSQTGLFHPTQIAELYITGLSPEKSKAYVAKYDGSTYSSSSSDFSIIINAIDVGYAWGANNTNEGTEADFNLYRVITIGEKNENNYEISALEHVPSKFDYIDLKNEQLLVTESAGPYIDIAKPLPPTKKNLGDVVAPAASAAPDGIHYDLVNPGRDQVDYMRIMQLVGGGSYYWYLLFNWDSPSTTPNGYYYKLYIDDQLLEKDYLTTSTNGFKFNLKDYGEIHSTIFKVEGVESNQSNFAEVKLSNKINLLLYSYNGDPAKDNIVLSSDYINLQYLPSLDPYNS